MIEIYAVIDLDVYKHFEGELNPIRFCSTVKQEYHNYINNLLNYDCDPDAKNYVVRAGRISELSKTLR